MPAGIPDSVFNKFDQGVRDRYDFDRAVYRGALLPIEGIVCPEHGEFAVRAERLRLGAGCQECGALLRWVNRRVKPAEFFARAREAHAGRYRYDESSFAGTAGTIRVECPEHGWFVQRAANHVFHKMGCPACAAATRGRHLTPDSRKKAPLSKIRNNKNAFIARARLVHGDLYEYANDYVGGRRPTTIICRVHGPFRQNPEKHLFGQGCPRCGQKSAPEADLLAFVSTFGHEIRARDRTTIKPKELDIYVPAKALAIEFCGGWWHSTFKMSETIARDKHACKNRACSALGIRLLTIFDDEWRERRPQVEAIIRRALSEEPSTGARKGSVVRVGDASSFYREHHIQGPTRRGQHYGLVRDGVLVACMTFDRGASQRGGTAWELVRFATSAKINGAAGRLMGAFVKEERPDEIVSFSDNRYFDGAMYEKLGFERSGDLRPDYSVLTPNALRRVHKALFKRARIPARIAEFGSSETFDPATDPRSEREMTALLKCARIYDCGKVRWLWRANTNTA